MTNTEKAVNAIVAEIRNDLDGYYSDWDISSWKELLRAYGHDSASMKEDVYYILGHTDGFDPMLCTDDCEIFDDTVPGGITSYRQLIAKVRKALNW